MRIQGLATALLVFAAASAHAGILNLRWNACLGDGGVANRNFACDTNSGSDVLVASFIPTTPVLGVDQMNATVNISFPGPVPAWWQFRTSGSCRIGSLAVSTVPPATASACIDWADGGRDGLSTYTIGGPLGAASSQISVQSPLVASTPFDLVAGQEYFAFSATINHQKTVGAGACAGCVAGACMALVRVELHRAAPQFPTDLFPSPYEQVTSWQGGAGIAVPNYGGTGFTICPGATPTRARTWGEVKSLYR